MSDSSAPQSFEDVELVRGAARAMNEHMSEGIKLTMSEIGSIGRWLTASLLAVNGAAAAAIFSAFDKLALPSGDAALFLAGVFAALCSGVLLQKASIAGAEMAGTAIGHALVVEKTGFYNKEAQAFADGMASRTRRLSLWPQLAGWVSAVLFAGGAMLTGFTGFKADTANDHRCLILQRDMLSSEPRKEDGIALFQALGCRPQGEGSVYAPSCNRARGCKPLGNRYPL